MVRSIISCFIQIVPTSGFFGMWSDYTVFYTQQLYGDMNRDDVFIQQSLDHILQSSISLNWIDLKSDDVPLLHGSQSSKRLHYTHIYIKTVSYRSKNRLVFFKYSIILFCNTFFSSPCFSHDPLFLKTSLVLLIYFYFLFHILKCKSSGLMTEATLIFFFFLHWQVEQQRRPWTPLCLKGKHSDSFALIVANTLLNHIFPVFDSCLPEQLEIQNNSQPKILTKLFVLCLSSNRCVPIFWFRLDTDSIPAAAVRQSGRD